MVFTATWIIYKHGMYFVFVRLMAHPFTCLMRPVLQIILACRFKTRLPDSFCASTIKKMKHKIVRLILHAHCEFYLLLAEQWAISATPLRLCERDDQPHSDWKLSTMISIFRPVKATCNESLALNFLALGSVQDISRLIISASLLLWVKKTKLQVW